MNHRRQADTGRGSGPDGTDTGRSAEAHNDAAQDEGAPGPQRHYDSPLRRTTLSDMVDKASAKQSSEGWHSDSPWRIVFIVGVLCIMVSLVGVFNRLQWRMIVGMVLLFAGISLSWMQTGILTEHHPASFFDDLRHGRASSSLSMRYILVLVGILTAFAGTFIAFSSFLDFNSLLIGVGAGLILITILVMIVAPWWISLISDLGKERAHAAQEELRADITAQLHDSVLQTLALIQLNADDPSEAAALAHAQERELREWLYGAGRASVTPAAVSSPASPVPVQPAAAPPAPVPIAVPNSRVSAGSGAFANPTTLAHELKRIMARIEDSSRVPIEVVTVGDARYRKEFEPLLSAAAEAALNAAHHGRPPVSVYCEVDPLRLRAVQIFIRDHGDGFDAAADHPGHMGITESIIGRMKRSKGSAQINSRKGWGTEVKLALPFAPENGSAAGKQPGAEADA